MNRKIEVFDYAKEIVSAIPKGVLLTTKNGDTVNTMTIGWGTLGVEWGIPIFIAFVREGRFTREILDASGEFTVNVPYGEFDRKILGYCGTKSGRDVNKISELGLTLAASDIVNAPGIRELPRPGLPQAVQCRQHLCDEGSQRDRGAVPGKTGGDAAGRAAAAGAKAPGAGADHGRISGGTLSGLR